MNIFEKISSVMSEVSYLSKDDKVEFGSTKYKAISEEKVTSIVRSSLIKNGIVIIPVEQEHHREGNLTTVDVTYRIQNIEDVNDYILAKSSGTGADTQDKGVGKAMTYAYKYLLLRTFAIPTGEDPDKISSAELDEKMEEEEMQKKAECGKIDELKISSLKSICDKKGVSYDFILKSCHVSDFTEITIKKFMGACEYLEKLPDKEL